MLRGLSSVATRSCKKARIRRRRCWSSLSKSRTAASSSSTVYVDSGQTTASELRTWGAAPGARPAAESLVGARVVLRPRGHVAMLAFLAVLDVDTGPI